MLTKIYIQLLNTAGVVVVDRALANDILVCFSHYFFLIITKKPIIDMFNVNFLIISNFSPRMATSIESSADYLISPC